MLVSGLYLDPDVMLREHMSVGVMAGSCDLREECESTDVATCLNDGTCITEWGQVQCLCDEYHYGDACQFGKL